MLLRFIRDDSTDKNVLFGIFFFDMNLSRVKFENDRGHWELEHGSVRNPCSKTQILKKCERRKEMEIFLFPIVDETTKFPGRDHEFRESTQRR